MELTRNYQAIPVAVANARAFVADAFTGNPARDDARLIASELAQNAVRYGTGDSFTVTITTTRRSVTVTVTNTGHSAPTVSDTTFADLDAEGGRGLPLMAVLAADYGITHSGGRTRVWFSFPAARRRAQDPIAADGGPRLAVAA